MNGRSKRRNLVSRTALGLFIVALPLAHVAHVAAQGSRAAAVNSVAEVTAVRRTWDGYKQGVLERNGGAALKLVSRGTVEHYGRMKELALRAPESEVRSLRAVDKIIVLSYRHRVPFGELLAMDAERLFAYGVERGWIGERGTLETTLGRVSVSGSVASGQAVVRGRATPLAYRFVKEDDAWKIDLTSVLPPADLAFKQAIKEMKVDEDEFILNILESLTGKKPPPTIWQPLQP